MSSSVNFCSRGVLARLRGLRTTVVFRPTAGCGLSVDFERAATLEPFAALRFTLAGFTGLVVPFVWVDSLGGVAEVTSGEIGSLALLKLFAIYFSCSSGSLYARKKTMQAEIGMDEALPKLDVP